MPKDKLILVCENCGFGHRIYPKTKHLKKNPEIDLTCAQCGRTNHYSYIHIDMRERIPLHDRVFLVICGIFNFFDKEYLRERFCK